MRSGQVTSKDGTPTGSVYKSRCDRDVCTVEHVLSNLFCRGNSMMKCVSCVDFV